MSLYRLEVCPVVCFVWVTRDSNFGIVSIRIFPRVARAAAAANSLARMISGFAGDSADGVDGSALRAELRFLLI